MRFAGSKDLENLSKPLIIESADYYEEGIVKIKESIEQVANGAQIQAIVGGVPGVLDKKRETLLRAPNMPGWEKKPLLQDMKRMLGFTPHIYNDTDMACMGEAMFGAGKGHKLVAYVTVSTGVGGSLVYDHQIFPYSLGLEPGFQIINDNSLKTLEDIVGGDSLAEKFGIPSKEIAKHEYWQEVVRTVVIGLHNTIVHWSPDVLVLGGSQMKDITIDQIKDGLKQVARNYPEMPEIKAAELGDLNGLYGGLAFAKSNWGRLQKEQ